jgi:hypothetical protein
MITADVLAAALRGEAAALESLSRVEEDELCRVATAHGVLPLVAGRLPFLRTHSARAAATDVVRERLLRELIEAFAQNGVTSLLFKGAQLAYSHYERPDLRPRFDSDVLVRPSDREHALRILAALDYRPVGQVSGRLVTSQATFVKREADVLAHAVDLHWRIANPQIFSDVFSFDQLAARSERLAALHPDARGLGAIDALLVACLHRVAHHFDDEYLVWLYDIHLIASRFGPSEWAGCLDTSRDRGVLTVCQLGLARASAHFGTVVPDDFRSAMPATGNGRETSFTRYLSHDHRQMRTLVDDLRALRRWTDRGRLIVEHLFPSPQYMRETYAPSSGAPLSLLYARRVLRGARKWLVR